MQVTVEQPEALAPRREGLLPLAGYFLKLGTIGFGGPVALVGYMHRDLVERRRWVAEETYRLALALAQIMPGPLAAQCAIALGYFEHGLLGASLIGLTFVLPSFIMVVALSIAYVAFGGLWWMQALFYGIGAAVIAIIAIAAYKLSRSTNKRDPLLWGIFAGLAIITVLSRAELAAFFVVAGLLVMLVKAPPAWLPKMSRAAPSLFAMSALQVAPAAADVSNGVLLDILLFFTKAGAFVFGSGLAVVPFLYQGVVQDFHWLNEQQFTDAVAVAMITPGPVVITVAFIGYLVAGLPGASLAAIGIFLPVFLPVAVLSPWFKRHRDNAQLKAFVQGATAAATGAITGSVVILGQRSIFDLPTAIVGLVSLGVLWRFKLHEPIVVAAAGLVGLAVWPLVHAGR
ncbi:MAG TPA: chromate efflux transporter [Chloroflexota bacterium]